MFEKKFRILEKIEDGAYYYTVQSKRLFFYTTDYLGARFNRELYYGKKEEAEKAIEEYIRGDKRKKEETQFKFYMYSGQKNKLNQNGILD
jgi:hypothetical protein